MAKEIILQVAVTGEDDSGVGEEEASFTVTGRIYSISISSTQTPDSPVFTLEAVGAEDNPILGP
jgi:hypothetical protein